MVRRRQAWRSAPAVAPCHRYMLVAVCPELPASALSNVPCQRSLWLLQGASEVEENLGWAWGHKETLHNWGCGGGDCFLEIRRSLRALGFAAQLAQLTDGRPPCCSTRKGHRERSHFPARPGELGRGPPHKALLTRLVESDPRAGAGSYPERSLLHSFLLEQVCWRPVSHVPCSHPAG